MLAGAPIVSVGYANSPTSGWMKGLLFIKVLEHIQRHTRCSKNDMIILLMDNHESHCTIEAISFCREHGIVLVTFPPHCTHRLQPLDVAVLGPFKQKFSVAQNDWLMNHPGKTITIHDLAGISNTAFTAAFTPRNILSGFAKPGIYPFTRTAFSDEDFECAEVTNRPMPEHYTAQVEPNIDLSTEVQNIVDSVLFSENYESNAGHDALNENVMSPEIARPFPKAAPRQQTNRGKKKGKSRILTETPEKNESEDSSIERPRHVKKLVISSLNKRLNINNAKKSKDSSSDSIESSFSVNDDTDLDSNFADDSSEDQIAVECHEKENIDLSYDQLNPGDYILVECSNKNNVKTLGFVAEITEKDENNYIVSFLKKKPYSFKFFYPDIADKWSINGIEIKAKLPTPVNEPLWAHI